MLGKNKTGRRWLRGNSPTASRLYIWRGYKGRGNRTLS